MKFSVLLPTRNRLEYLKFAVESVRRQDYEDWEIVISDNFSEDDIAGYVQALDDRRVIYVRTSEFVPVTENWNNALKYSTGDYVVMLGDDDGLLPGYFSTMVETFKAFPYPDFVYVSALFFAYPGVMPDEPQGFLRLDHNKVFTESEPYWLDHTRARSVARGYLDFQMPVASNMQFSLVSRRKIESMSSDGQFYHSPYPDFYATPALFLTSDRILIYPEPMVVIGITPKSYGFFHFNHRAGDGVKFLNNTGEIEAEAVHNRVMLPGTSYNDSWLLAMEALRSRHSEQRGMLPNYGAYRRLQIIHCYKKRYFDQVRDLPMADLRARMTVLEKVQGSAMQIAFSLLRFFPSRGRGAIIAHLRKLIGQHAISMDSSELQFKDLIGVYESIEATGPWWRAK